jgi:hypothetical protein
VHRRRKRARRHWRVSDDAHRSAIRLTFSRRARVRRQVKAPIRAPRFTQEGGARPPRSAPSPALLGPWVNGPRCGRSRSARRAPAAKAAVQRRLKRSTQSLHTRGGCPVSLDVPARPRPVGRTETLTERTHRRQHRGRPGTDETAIHRNRRPSCAI